MSYSMNESITVDGESYQVIGRITFRNKSDGCSWDEYRLKPFKHGQEKWLSIDTTYKEYSISHMAGNAPVPSDYHKVDDGIAEVISYDGNVDVDMGETVRFEEYEDPTEEKIFSIERWGRECEYSRGYYLDHDEIVPFPQGGHGKTARSYGGSYNDTSGYRKRHGSGCGGYMFKLWLFITVMVAATVGCVAFLIAFEDGAFSTIKKHLDKENTKYTYVTSITGADSKQKADVYSSTYSTDYVTRDIIDYLNGETEYVQQNDLEEDDDSIAIITKREYCLVYTSKEGETMVQVSNRKYAYQNDSEPYHCTDRTYRYYRRAYHSKAYSMDRVKYDHSYSPYETFDDVSIQYNNGDTYTSYADSVRQASIQRRSSSGGGTHYGK